MGSRFAVFDIDGTLIRWQLYHAVADRLAKQGHFDAGKFSEVKKYRMLWKKRDSDTSFREYEQKLVELVDDAITGITVAELGKACAGVIDEFKDQVYTFTRNLVKELKSKGYLLFAISASQAEIVEMLAKYYGFDDFGGSRYEVKNDKFTGNKTILKSDQKPIYLKKLMAKHGTSLSESVGVGDSESDIPMLNLVENPIAFNPTKALYEHAKSNKWQIVIERKNVIYKLDNLDGKYLLV